METRRLGSTGYEVSAVGLSVREDADVVDEQGREPIRTALDVGVTFFDTADVHGRGDAERRLGRALDGRDEDTVVATKVGRRLDSHAAADYTYENIERFVDSSRENLGVETLDLLQLHRPPPDVYYRPETFHALEDLREAGTVAHYGVCVERVEEALKAIEYPGVETVEVVFNPFRQRPAERLFEAARKGDVGVIARVPLASGLLAGTAVDEFVDADDGAFEPAGETLAGVPLREGVAAIDALREHVPAGMSLAQFTLRWILDHAAVSTVVPSSTNPRHVHDNVSAADLDPLSHETYGAVRDVYEAFIADRVHHRW